MRKRGLMILGWVAAWAALAALPSVWAAWDSTKPAAGSAVLSADVRSNFQAIEQSALAVNVVSDPTFQLWPAGAAAAPYGWTLSGAGAAVAQDTANLNGLGPYAVKLTYGSASAVLSRAVYGAASGSNGFPTYLRGRTFSAAMAVKTSTASQARVEINDGVGSSYSSYHTGDGTYQWLTVTRTLDSAATVVTLNFRVDASGSAYAQGVNAVYGPIPGSQLMLNRLLYDGREIHRSPLGMTPDRLNVYALAGKFGWNATTVTAAATGPTDLHAYTIKANMLANDGDSVRLTAMGRINTSSTTTWYYNLSYGGTATTIVSSNGNATGNVKIVVDVIRTGASAQLVMVQLVSSTGVANIVPADGGVFTAAFSNVADQVIKITGQSGTSPNAVDLRGSYIELLPNSSS